MGYDYKSLPAPRQISKVAGAKTPQEKCARLLENLLNAQAADGWDYMGSETLTCEYRTGLLRRREISAQTVLVFRRAKTAARPAPSISAQTAAPPPAPAARALPSAAAPKVATPEKPA